jgi:hypothetical protein
MAMTDEISATALLKSMLPIMVVAGAILAAFWAFNDHFLSIREHEDYKAFILQEDARLSSEILTKVSKQEYEKQLKFNERIAAELQRQPSAVEAEVKDGVIARQLVERNLAEVKTVQDRKK